MTQCWSTYTDCMDMKHQVESSEQKTNCDTKWRYESAMCISGNKYLIIQLKMSSHRLLIKHLWHDWHYNLQLPSDNLSILDQFWMNLATKAVCFIQNKKTCLEQLQIQVATPTDLFFTAREAKAHGCDRIHTHWQNQTLRKHIFLRIDIKIQMKFITKAYRITPLFLGPRYFSHKVWENSTFKHLKSQRIN